jgi:hypothetical protein
MWRFYVVYGPVMLAAGYCLVVYLLVLRHARQVTPLLLFV